MIRDLVHLNIVREVLFERYKTIITFYLMKYIVIDSDLVKLNQIHKNIRLGFGKIQPNPYKYTDIYMCSNNKYKRA